MPQKTKLADQLHADAKRCLQLASWSSEMRVIVELHRLADKYIQVADAYACDQRMSRDH